MPNRTTSTRRPDALAEVQGETQLDRLNNFLATIPTIEADPTETMLQAILESESPADWEKVFNARHFKDSATSRWRIHDWRTSESNFGGRLKYFLVLDITDLGTGERTVATCGSEMAVAQLVNAKGRGALPIDVEVVRKETPTKAGFHPMRFSYIGDAAAPLGDPAAVVSEQ